jgi:hypothetical protein
LHSNAIVTRLHVSKLRMLLLLIFTLYVNKHFIVKLLAILPKRNLYHFWTVETICSWNALSVFQEIATAETSNKIDHFCKCFHIKANFQKCLNDSILFDFFLEIHCVKYIFSYSIWKRYALELHCLWKVKQNFCGTRSLMCLSLIFLRDGNLQLCRSWF